MKKNVLLAMAVLIACNKPDRGSGITPIGGFEPWFGEHRVDVMGSRYWREADGFYDFDVYCRDRGRVLRFRYSEASGELRVWCEPIPDERKAGK